MNECIYKNVLGKCFLYIKELYKECDDCTLQCDENGKCIVDEEHPCNDYDEQSENKIHLEVV